MCSRSTTCSGRPTPRTSSSPSCWTIPCGAGSSIARSTRAWGFRTGTRRRWQSRWARRWTTSSGRSPTPYARASVAPAGSPSHSMHAWSTALGAFLTVLILWDAFQTIILSRRVSRRLRPTRAFYRMLWTPIRAVVKRIPPGNRRENILMVFGPLSLLCLIALWAYGLILGVALLHWGLGSQIIGPGGITGFGVDLYMSGTTFFTLGLGDATPRTGIARALTVLECGMGFAFLALVIGYLPLISEAFSRREVNISMLDASAGSPPTAGQLILRHCRDDDADLRGLFRDWERWAAELLESHISFPV